ncbi:hypothetical protein [Streptomyces sp. NBC_00316]|uniref:hypothetical protein n=1 Tax=Streptomyces sp. NBC_00316 TaxID=2975710 RepID=UPI002E2AAF3E|nr:hypothetical protein [Streptomyces sp. NBC_00316]
MVEGPGQLTVCSSSRLKLLGPFFELARLLGEVLFEQSDLSLELVDVDWGSEP